MRQTRIRTSAIRRLRKVGAGPLSTWIVLPFFAMVLFATEASAQPLDLPAAPEIRPEVLTPKLTPSEADEDRIHASALFSEGRVLFRHDEFEQALAKYQRAYRYSNQSYVILDEIVPLAFRLGRVGQALEYAALLDERSKVDPFILRRLAIFQTELDDFDGALELYRLSTRASNEGQVTGAELIADFEIGRLSFLVEDYKEAADRFAKVMSAIDADDVPPENKVAVDALTKDSSATFSLIAEAYLEANRLDEAEILFRRALADRKQRPMLHYQLARIASARKQPDEAIDELEQYMDSESEEAGTAPYELLEEVLTKTEDATIVERMAELYQQQPKNIFAGYYLAQLLLKSGQSSKAVPVLEKLIADRPLLDAYRGLMTAYFQEGDVAKFCILLADAVEKLDGVEEIKETLEPISADAGFVAELREAADRLFLKQKPDSAERRKVARSLAHVALLQKDFDAADRYFELAVGEGDKRDTDVWLNWAIEQMIADRLDAAAANLERLAKQQLSDADLGTVNYYLSGALALKDDQTDASVNAAVASAELLPDIPSIQMRPAWALTLGERWPDARRRYLEFLEKFGDQFGSNSVRDAVREAKSNLSTIEVELNDTASAEEWLEQILDEHPSDIGTMNDLGYLWADRGVHLGRALRMIRLATEAEPENLAYRDSLGWVLFRLGRLEDAIVELQRAVATEKPDGIILDHLGDALAANEDVDSAREKWQQATDLLKDSNPELAEKIRKKLESQP